MYTAIRHNDYGTCVPQSGYIPPSFFLLFSHFRWFCYWFSDLVSGIARLVYRDDQCVGVRWCSPFVWLHLCCFITPWFVQDFETACGSCRHCRKSCSHRPRSQTHSWHVAHEQALWRNLWHAVILRRISNSTQFRAVNIQAMVILKTPVLAQSGWRETGRRSFLLVWNHCGSLVQLWLALFSELQFSCTTCFGTHALGLKWSMGKKHSKTQGCMFTPSLDN